MHIYPENLKVPSNTHQARLDAAFKLASKSPGSILHLETQRWEYKNPLTLEKPYGVVIIGSMHFDGFVGPGIYVNDPKPVTFENLWMRGGGIHVRSNESANAFFNRCRVQESIFGFDLEAQGGADISRVSFRDCESYNCLTGFRIAGSNALDPHFSFCSASYCDIGFDLRIGGSNYVIDHCSGSYSKTLIHANSGYQGSIRDLTCELCELPVMIGGDLYGGHDVDNFVDISMLDVRGTSGEYLANVGCRARVDLGHNYGKILARSPHVEVIGLRSEKVELF